MRAAAVLHDTSPPPPPQGVGALGLSWVNPWHRARHAAVAWAGAAIARELDYRPLFSVDIWQMRGWREAFLFVCATRSGPRIVGAGGCRLPKYPNLPQDLRELVFVYFHPQFRGRGLFQQAWPQLISRWGPFVIQAPLSDAMTRFLSHQAHHVVPTTNDEPAVMVFGTAAANDTPQTALRAF